MVFLITEYTFFENVNGFVIECIEFNMDYIDWFWCLWFYELSNLYEIYFWKKYFDLRWILTCSQTILRYLVNERCMPVLCYLAGGSYALVFQYLGNLDTILVLWYLANRSYVLVFRYSTSKNYILVLWYLTSKGYALVF